jgi:putative copper export protein
MDPRPQPASATEPPPDPAALEVARKIEKVSAISRLILFAGIGAVFAVIGYRLYAAPSSPAGTRETQIEVSGRVISAVANGQQLTVTTETAQGTVITVHDVATGRVTHRIAVQPPR